MCTQTKKLFRSARTRQDNTHTHEHAHSQYIQNTDTNTDTHTHTHTKTHTHTHPHTTKGTNTHTQTRTHTPIFDTLTTHGETHTQTHTHTKRLTDTHTQTQKDAHKPTSHTRLSLKHTRQNGSLPMQLLLEHIHLSQAWVCLLCQSNASNILAWVNSVPPAQPCLEVDQHWNANGPKGRLCAKQCLSRPHPAPHAGVCLFSFGTAPMWRPQHNKATCPVLRYRSMLC